MSDEDDEALPLKEIVNLSIKATGNDLFEIIRRIQAVEKEKGRVEAESKLVLSRSRRLAEINQRLYALQLAQMVAKEQVFADPQQYQVYLKQKRLAATRAAEEAQTETQDASADDSGKKRRSALRDYLKNWSAEKADQPEREKKKEAESETEPGT